MKERHEDNMGMLLPHDGELPKTPEALVEELRVRLDRCKDDLDFHFYTGYYFALSDIRAGLKKQNENKR